MSDEQGSETGAAHEAAGLSSGLAGIDRKLRELQAELASVDPAVTPPPARAVAPEPAQRPPAAAAGSPGEELAVGVIARAEEQAGSIVEAAHERVVALNRQAEEMMRLREAVRRSILQLLADFGAALERLESAGAAPPVPPPAAAPEPAPSPAPETRAGEVTIEATPFAQVGTLAAFVEALGALPGARDVSVHAFDGQRATVALFLGEPVALQRELHRVLPFSVEVTSETDTSISLRLEGTS